MASIRRRFKIPKVVKNLLFVVLLLLVFDVVLVGLGSFYLRAKISFFSEKSGKTVLSDLLFLEGATVFTLGAFAAYTVSEKKRPSHEYGAECKVTADEQLHQRRIPVWMLIMIIGVTLMGLSVAIAALPVQ